MSKTVSGSTSQFLWDVASALPALVRDGAAAYVYGPGGSPLEQINGSTVLWIHHDQPGNTRLVTDGNGATLATYTFDSYGLLTASTGSVTNPFRFAGQYTDFESGLYYLRARYYDPTTGQFLSIDPAMSATRQPYGYVSGNPLNDADPTGMVCWAFWDASKCNNAFSSWTSQNQAPLQEAGNAFDSVARVSGTIAAGCALGAAITSATVVGGFGFGACATAAGTIAVGSQLSAIGLHGLAGIGGNHSGWEDSGTDAVGLIIGRLVGASCRQVGSNSPTVDKDVWNGLSDAFGERFGGIYSSTLPH